MTPMQVSMKADAVESESVNVASKLSDSEIIRHVLEGH